MSTKLILQETQGSCQTIILNRPESRNAFNFELAEALAEALARAARDTQIRAVLLRGAGESFSAGGDLKLFHQNLEKSFEAFQRVTTHLNHAITEIVTMPKPVIAAVQGPAYAAGFGVAIACDLVVASLGSKLSPSFVNIALAPNAGSTFFLPRILGPRLAIEAFMTGRVFSAPEAKDLGLVNHVWAEESFEEELNLLLQDLLRRPTSALGRMKKLIAASFKNSWHEQLELEKQEIAESSTEKNFKEGVRAFVEKRRPNFE